MIQTVHVKNRYSAPETEELVLQVEPMRGFCSDTPPLSTNPEDDSEIPFD